MLRTVVIEDMKSKNKKEIEHNNSKLKMQKLYKKQPKKIDEDAKISLKNS